MVDSTYSNLDGAIEVARGLHGEKHYDGVKVIKENFDAATGDAKETTVYDSNKVIKSPASAKATSYEGEEEKKVAVRFTTAALASSGKSGNNDLALAAKALILLAIILAGGGGVLFGVDYLTALLGSLF